MYCIYVFQHLNWDSSPKINERLSSLITFDLVIWGFNHINIITSEQILILVISSYFLAEIKLAHQFNDFQFTITMAWILNPFFVAHKMLFRAIYIWDDLLDKIDKIEVLETLWRDQVNIYHSSPTMGFCWRRRWDT